MCVTMKDVSLLSMDIKPELARTARGLFDKLVNSFGSIDPLATSSRKKHYKLPTTYFKTMDFISYFGL